MTDGLLIHRGEAPLVLAMPHTGTDIPVELEARFVSPWLARRDTDWWIDRLYAFATNLGATTVRTSVSRSVIDCNRDPSGASLYPGQATTELCPTTTFDGEALYRDAGPDAAEIAWRTDRWHAPYHAAIRIELARLQRDHGRVVLYDAHSIRSRIPRLFDGELPHFNIGSNSGRACDPALTAAVAAICADSGRDHVVDGRFKGGWTTVISAGPTTASTPCRWSWPCAATCGRRTRRRPRPGPRPTTPPTPRPSSRRSPTS